MNRMRIWLPVLIGLALVWWACDSRTVTQSVGGTDGGSVSSVEVSVDNPMIYYSQSTRTAVSDTISVLVLDENRTAMAGVDVACDVSSSFGGGLEPLTERMTDDTGVARYVFRVLSSDDAFNGTQVVSFVATAGSRSGSAQLTLAEQSDIQLSFLNPMDGGTLYRMEDPAETVPVQVYAYRDMESNGQSQRVGVMGVLVNFTVTASGGGIPGTITVNGLTGSDGVTQSVYYSNSSEQPADTVQVTFTAAISGSDQSTASQVNFLNHYGDQLEQILPQTVNLQSDMLCADSTQFVFQFKDRDNQPIAGARFNAIPDMGEMVTSDQYTPISDEGGLLRFSWRNCEAAGGTVTFALEHVGGRDYYFAYDVAEARPVELEIISPTAGGELEVDSECLDENQTPVRARLRYADDNNPIMNQNVLFSANLGEIGSSALTDLNGIAEVVWHDCDESDSGETLTLAAAYYGNSSTPVLQSVIQNTIGLPLGVPHHINVGVENNVLPTPDDGNLQSEVTATVFNSQNQRLGANLAIGFRTNGIGSVTASGFTDENGEADAMFTMNNQTGISQILAYYVKPNTAPAETLWSTPNTITVNSGLPANVILSTATPRIQILGYGAASVAQVDARVVDSQGATVTFNVPVRFTIENGPEEVFLSIPGEEGQYLQGDTLSVDSQNGLARMTINAGRRPGPVQIGCFIDGNNYEVYSNESLVTILAGPPAYGEIDHDPQGNQDAGAGTWRVEWSVHLWDQYSNDVADSTAVWFHLIPEGICSMEGFGLTGVTADGEEGFPGIAGNWMTYHCNTIGDTLLQVRATTQGVVPEIDPWTEDTTWTTGTLNIDFVEEGSFFQIPFQSGDRDDNLTLISNVTQIQFDMAPCNSHFDDYVPVQAVLIDGYGCPVKNQQVCFAADFNLPWEFLDEETGEWVPEQCWVTNNAGVINARLHVFSEIMEVAAPCPEDLGADCWSYVPLVINYGASRQPGGPSSNQLSVTMIRGCQN